MVLIAAEAVLQLVLAESSLDLWRAGAMVVLGVALLLRHRHWRWLLPVLLTANALPLSLTVLIVVTYSYATRSQHRVLTALMVLLAIATGAVPTMLLVGDEPFLGVTGLALVTLVTVASAATGMYTSARRALLAELQERAEQAESGRAAAEEQARRAERTRIAREMHDIVAHKISLVAMHAGALEVNPSLDRAQVQDSAGLIRQTATTALSELREVLGVLRGDEEEAPLAPQPTWEDVRRLVTTSQQAGITVDLFDFIDDEVPDPLARTAYRVVQEGLTNIHKHALHTKARVALIGEPGTELVIEVSNVLPKGFTTDLPGARMGLSGIETRVTHAGGTITSGPTDDGRFEVRAVIPWPTAT
ncbi:two-component sensor histidine kinase [Brachybacterium saurashtrense]|uniref:histidine kinase n=1 Tax=Brachybacterium saurashtrense TaxID=556288 RepID=A0A345YTJ0_9MICO|nr:two-component sensor histidine kinase [Brachybacterium saurashtrense]RRR24365.1 two-component sensor histidine kinase [Brachybacterium saurashtrense]